LRDNSPEADEDEEDEDEELFIDSKGKMLHLYINLKTKKFNSH
jgi:hypothetical protein